MLSKKTGATPNTVGVRHTWVDTLGQWTEVEMSLFDDEGRAQWFEHPVHGRMVDVVALEVPQDLPSVATIYAWNLEQAGPAQLTVPDDVSIVGFPFGITGGAGFAIWSRGTVATELDFHHDGLPMFLVDSRTRSGQSGAPVFWYSSHGLIPVKGGWMLNDGTNPPMSLLGLYSGRVNPQSDLGRVFTLTALREIIDGAVRSEESWID